MHVSMLSEFIQSDVSSNTLLRTPNEFRRTVFERLEALEIQYSLTERETISHNWLLGVLTFKVTCIAFCLRFFIAAIRSVET